MLVKLNYEVGWARREGFREGGFSQNKRGKREIQGKVEMNGKKEF